MNLLPPTRREFLRTVTGAVLGSALPISLRDAARTSETITISILHTTDLHGHILPTVDYSGESDLGGLARCATQIQQWREENPHSVLIDVGDVYQGTQFSWADRGRKMLELLNLLQYDAWIIGNHEFDWGIDPFLCALELSAMPVLGANVQMEKKPAGEFCDSKHPFSKIQPFLLKEIAGIKLVIIGLTTPGMPFWFPPQFTAGLTFENAIEPARRALSKARSSGADAIIFAGHMGLKERTGGDDFANQVMALTAEFPGVAVFIAGHTHQDVASRLTNGTLFTQADHFGIHVGRVDLVFECASRKLLRQSSRCELMDKRVPLDPVVLSRSQSQLEEAGQVLAQPVGTLADSLGARGAPGNPSELERLIALAICEALHQHGVGVDGVFHGLFQDQHVLQKGQKTIGDLWQILPYENYLVTAELLPSELRVVMEEVLQSHEPRSLTGFRFRVEGEGSGRSVTKLVLDDGRPLDSSKRYRIALNTFDARSAGHRFMKLRTLLDCPAAHTTFHPVQTRDALIGYFRRHKIIRRSDLLPAA